MSFGCQSELDLVSPSPYLFKGLQQFTFKPAGKFSCAPISISMVRIIKANVNPHRIVSPPSPELPEEKAARPKEYRSSLRTSLLYQP
jgi:hypothetical protein